MQSQERYTQIDAITKAGEYLFSADPNPRTYSYPYVHVDLREQCYLSGYHPSFESLIPYNIKERYPTTQEIIFHQATLRDGEYIPASLEYKPDWHRSITDRQYIVYGGEVYEITSEGRSSNGYGSWGLSLKDIGNLSIVKNRLVIAGALGRDGELRIWLSGTAPHFHRDYGEKWQGSLDLKGESPGILIKAALNYVNQTSQNLKFSIWKQDIPQAS